MPTLPTEQQSYSIFEDPNSLTIVARSEPFPNQEARDFVARGGITLRRSDGTIITTGLQTDFFIEKMLERAEAVEVSPDTHPKKRAARTPETVTSDASHESNIETRFEGLEDEQKDHLVRQIQIYSLLDSGLAQYCAGKIKGINLNESEPINWQSVTQPQKLYSIRHICQANLNNRRAGVDLETRIAEMAWHLPVTKSEDEAIKLAVYYDRVCDFYEEMIGADKNDTSVLNDLITYFNRFAHSECFKQEALNGFKPDSNYPVQQTLLFLGSDNSLNVKHHSSAFALLNREQFLVSKSHKTPSETERLPDSYNDMQIKLQQALSLAAQKVYKSEKHWEAKVNEIITEISGQYHHDIMKTFQVTGQLTRQNLELNSPRYLVPTACLDRLGLGRIQGLGAFIPKNGPLAPKKQATIFSSLKHSLWAPEKPYHAASMAHIRQTVGGHVQSPKTDPNSDETDRSHPSSLYSQKEDSVRLGESVSPRK